MTYDLQQISDAKSKAMIGLMAKEDSSFFTTLAFSMKWGWNDRIQTARTDGTSIEMNPEFFMGLKPEARIGLLVHESCHVAYLHALRLNGRDHTRFNQAADHVINLELLERGFSLPPNGLWDRQYKGMCTEEVYDLLPPCPPDYPLADLVPCPEDKDIEEIEQEVADILVRAAIQSAIDGDKPGTIPGDIQIYLDGLLKPKLPWHQILRRWIQQQSKADYSFRKPNRRFFPQHYLPSLHTEKVIDLVFAVDASGSVTDHEFHQFVSEVASVFRMMKPENVTLIQFDHGLRSVTKLKNIQDLLQCEFTGRGGTDITELVQWAKENKPKLMLVFTDGEFRFYNEGISTPLVWLIHNNKGFTAPYGNVIHYDIKP